MNAATKAAPAPEQRKTALHSEADIDRFAERIARLLTSNPGGFCARIEQFCDQIEDLLVQAERRRRL